MQRALCGIASLYTATHLVGYGTYGLVFRCLDTASGQEVAVKIILAEEDAPVPCVNESAIIELRWTLAMHGRHKNVVCFNRVLVLTDFTVCFVMKLYTCTLYAAVRKHVVTPQHARAVFTQVAAAVCAMHAHGLCHRDLKSANILLDAISGDAVVADLGIARDHVDERATFTALTGEVVTVGYAPVEALQGVGSYGTSIDVWSLGVILAELALQAPPFRIPVDVERSCHVPITLRTLGIPTDADRHYLNAKCYVPWRIIDACPDTSSLLLDLTTKDTPTFVIDAIRGMLRIVPDARLTAQCVLSDMLTAEAIPSELPLTSFLPSEIQALTAPYQTIQHNSKDLSRDVPSS